MNKIIKLSFVLIIITFVLTFSDVFASSIDYELNIDATRHFSETITYTIENNTDNKYLKKVLNNDIYFDKNKSTLYKKIVEKNGSFTVVKLIHDYNYNDLLSSRIINECFKSVQYDTDDNQIVFATYEPFYCKNKADNITVSVITDIDVLVTSADMVENNKHVWKLEDGAYYVGIRIGNADSDINTPRYSIIPTADDIGDTYTGIKTTNKTLIIISTLCVIAFIVISVIFLKRRFKCSRRNDSIYDE